MNRRFKTDARITLQILGVMSAAVLLSACTVTETELRTEPNEHATFYVALPYAQVLNNFSTAATGCFSGGTKAAFMSVTRSEAEPGSKGKVLITEFGEFGTNRVLLAVDISKAESGTDIEYFRRHIMIVNNAQPVLEGWALGVDKGCGLPFN